jgi:hypothetical protein
VLTGGHPHMREGCLGEGDLCFALLCVCVCMHACVVLGIKPRDS